MCCCDADALLRHTVRQTFFLNREALPRNAPLVHSSPINFVSKSRGKTSRTPKNKFIQLNLLACCCEHMARSTFPKAPGVKTVPLELSTLAGDLCWDHRPMLIYLNYAQCICLWLICAEMPSNAICLCSCMCKFGNSTTTWLGFIGGFMMHVAIYSTRSLDWWAARLDYQSCGFVIFTALQRVSKYLTLPSIWTINSSK